MAIFRQSADESRLPTPESRVAVVNAVGAGAGVPRSVALNGQRFAPK